MAAASKQQRSDPDTRFLRSAVREIILVADNVPHDNELNEGIPQEFWVRTPFDTGIDPGPDNTVGTADDVDWQATLQRLNAVGKPLEYVDYQGSESYVPYWQFWSGITGGS